MSADLFAEFSVSSQSTASTGQTSAPAKNPHTTSTVPFAATAATTRATEVLPPGQAFLQDDDQDGWGDFEVAGNAPEPPHTIPFPMTETNSGQQVQVPGQRRTRLLRVATLDLVSNKLIDVPDTGAQATSDDRGRPSWVLESLRQQEEFARQKQAREATKDYSAPEVQPGALEVLFDADDFIQNKAGDDDDFGDFETSEPAMWTGSSQLQLKSGSRQPTPPSTSMEGSRKALSTLSLQEPRSPYPQAPKSPSFHERNPFPGLKVMSPVTARPAQEGEAEEDTSPITAWPSLSQLDSVGANDCGDNWAEFEDRLDKSSPDKEEGKATNDGWEWEVFDSKGSADAGLPTAQKATNEDESRRQRDWTVTEVDRLSQEEDSDNAIPPINVPPPSIILSLFPQLLAQVNTALSKPVGGEADSVKSRIVSDAKSIELLRGYLALATVAGRVIAGRKLRWHRDKFLSQSMSISTAGSKGMKLAGIDKTQAVRDDREATDVLDLWTQQVGRLRSAVATANLCLEPAKQHLVIPELRDKMQVQTAKAVPTAPKACVVCGLRRDERISRVDFDVEDSFGEWWVEHWGHTACKRFWLRHEKALRQG